MANIPYTIDSFFLDGGLVQEYLPGNIINANLQGVSTFFNKNTPVDYVNRSLAFLQQSKPDIVEVIPGENGKSDNTQTPQDKSFWDKIIGSIFDSKTSKRICSDAQGNIVDASREGQPGIRCTTSNSEITNQPGKVTSNVSEDLLRIGLFALGGALVIVAINKMI